MPKKVNNYTSNKWKHFVRHGLKNDASENYMFASRRCTPHVRETELEEEEEEF
jgi:hypothetical protein